MKTAAEIKYTLIEDLIYAAAKKGENSVILGKTRGMIYNWITGFLFNEIIVYEAICSLDEAKYLKELGYKLDLLRPYSSQDYESVRLASLPKKTGFFRRFFTGVNTYIDSESIRASDVLKAIDNLPDVVRVSW